MSKKVKAALITVVTSIAAVLVALLGGCTLSLGAKELSTEVSMGGEGVSPSISEVDKMSTSPAEPPTLNIMKDVE